MADEKPTTATAKKSKRITYKEWMEKHPKTVFTHAAPKEVSRIEWPEVLKFFNEEFATRLGLDPLSAIGDPTQSWCHADSLPGTGWYVCDEDSES